MMNSYTPQAVVAALFMTTVMPASALVIVPRDVGGLTGSAAASSFGTAARFWESIITNDVTVQLDVGFLPNGASVGTTSTVSVQDVQSVEARLRAGGRSALDAVVATKGLPALDANGALTVTTPGYVDPVNRLGVDTNSTVLDGDGSANNLLMGLTTANAKALGYTFDPQTADAQILFESQFPYDFDPRNGIGANQLDFVDLAIHEIGHALGFISGVDDYDSIGCPFSPACAQFADYPVNDTWWGYTLDLFRYSVVGLDWSVAPASFTPPYFSVDTGQTQFNGLSGFSTGRNAGDGSQASHWAKDFFSSCSTHIGIMDPSICLGQGGKVTATDLAAFDAIGWNLNIDVVARPDFAESTAQIATALTVSEPDTLALLLSGLAVFCGALRNHCHRTRWQTWSWSTSRG